MASGIGRGARRGRARSGRARSGRARSGRARRWWRFVAVVAIVALGAGACGSSSTKATDATDSSATSADTTGTTAAAPSAADDLAPFFAAVVETDRRLHVASDAVNGGIGADTVSFDQATRDAVVAASPDPTVVDAIPAGMPDDLEQAVLLVYSGLVSRQRSLSQPDCLRDGTFPRSELLPECFAAGHVAAARFDADVAAARALAESTAPLVIPAPDARVAADLHVREATIRLANGGCAGGGGSLATKPIEVNWKPEQLFAGDRPWDGRVDGIPFRATYAPATGWKVELNAC